MLYFGSEAYILIIAHLPRVEGVPEDVMLMHSVFCYIWVIIMGKGVKSNDYFFILFQV